MKRPPASEPLERELGNGLRVVVSPLPHLRAASIVVAFGVGSRHEAPEDSGLTHLLEHMVYRGTARFPTAYELNHAIESLGGDLDGATMSDATTFAVTVPPGSVAEALDVMSEVFVSPRFGQLDVEKRIVKEEILEGLDEDGVCIDADDLSRRQIWGQHPLGQPIIGSEARIDAFDEGDLRRHLERAFVAGNAVLSVAGPVDAEAVFEAAASTFGRLRAGVSAPPEPPPDPSAGPSVEHVEDTGSQTTVRLAFPAFGERDPRCAALMLLVRILDDGMSARLHRHLIDERGLAYDAWAGLDLHVDCGVLDVGGTCAHESAPELVREMLAVLGDLASSPIAPSELEHVRRRHLWDLEASVDDAEDVAEHAALATLFQLPRSTQIMAEAIRRVTPEEIEAVAREVLKSQRLHVVTVGMLSRKRRSEVDAIARRWHPDEASCSSRSRSPAS
ncbi:MAG: pitrilysin family protein [Sandaracinaceae bacterium]